MKHKMSHDEGRVLLGNIKYHLLDAIILATQTAIDQKWPTTGSRTTIRSITLLPDTDPNSFPAFRLHRLTLNLTIQAVKQHETRRQQYYLPFEQKQCH